MTTGEDQVNGLISQFCCFSFSRCHLFLNRFKLLFACLPEINGITGIVQAEERNEFQCFALCRINLSVIAESNPAILFFLKRFAD